MEAAHIIGLSDARTFWKITVPQAIRVAIPPLINQYISLTKSSSLAIAIGYTDLFSVGVIAIAGSAFAADLPYRAPPPVYLPPPPIFTWTGIYLGG